MSFFIGWLWPRTKHAAEHCEACQRMKLHNQKETQRLHSDGEGPWLKVWLDLFDLDSGQYLVTVDHFPSFTEVDNLTSMTATDVIKLQVHFAQYGNPSEIFFNQGPQFTVAQFQSMHTVSLPGYHQSKWKG